MTDFLEILDHPVIGQRYFFPRYEPVSQPFWVECDGARLACSYHEAARDALTVVHFHGNGEVVADYLDGFCDLITGMGYNLFLAEFRGYGGSTGKPQLGRMLADVRRIIETIDRPHNRLVLFGRSVGSLFAVKAVELFPDLAGLILESAVADPLERLLLRLHPEELGTTMTGLAAAVSQAMDIRRTLESFTGQTLVLHSRHDGLIDVSHAERLAAWCGGPVRLEIFGSGDHNSIMFINARRYFAIVREYLVSLDK